MDPVHELRIVVLADGQLRVVQSPGVTPAIAYGILSAATTAVVNHVMQQSEAMKGPAVQVANGEQTRQLLGVG